MLTSPEIIYSQLKNIREINIDGILQKHTSIDPSSTVLQTINAMINANTYDVFCINDNNVLTINARDVMGIKEPEKTKVFPFLHKIQPLKRTDTVEKAASILSHYRMRSVPVVSGGQIIGEVHVKQIVSLLRKQNLKWIPASSILTSDLITIDNTDTFATARKIITTKRIDHLPVIKNDKVSQVLTSMHLLQTIKPTERIGKGMKGLDLKKKYDLEIGNTGSTRIPNLNTNVPLSTVIDSLIENDTSCCLFTLWGNVHGIITYKDIVNILESKIPSEVPLFIIGMPDDHRDSEIIKTKFEKIVRNLRKAYPELEQVKVSIKTVHNPKVSRRHYDIKVRVITPYKTYNYAESGWDLSKIFDTIGGIILRSLTKRSKKRWKTTIRKIDKRSIF